MLGNPASTDGAKVGDGTFAIMVGGLAFGEDDRHDDHHGDQRERGAYPEHVDIVLRTVSGSLTCEGRREDTPLLNPAQVTDSPKMTPRLCSRRSPVHRLGLDWSSRTVRLEKTHRVIREDTQIPIVRIEHSVPNFEKWKQAFDSDLRTGRARAFAATGFFVRSRCHADNGVALGAGGVFGAV